MVLVAVEQVVPDDRPGYPAQFEGIAELKHALENLPTELKGQATAIVSTRRTRRRTTSIAQYPTGPTGNLKKGVKVTVKEIGPFGVAAQVRSAAPHAWLYEFGTEARHYVTGSGKPRSPAGCRASGRAAGVYSHDDPASALDVRQSWRR